MSSLEDELGNVVDCDDSDPSDHEEEEEEHEIAVVKKNIKIIDFSGCVKKTIQSKSLSSSQTGSPIGSVNNTPPTTPLSTTQTKIERRGSLISNVYKFFGGGGDKKRSDSFTNQPIKKSNTNYSLKRSLTNNSLKRELGI